MSALKFVQLLDELSKYTNFEKLPEALLQSSVFNNSQFAQWLMRLQMQILHGCACARIAYFTVFFWPLLRPGAFVVTCPDKPRLGITALTKASLRSTKLFDEKPTYRNQVHPAHVLCMKVLSYSMKPEDLT